MITIEVNDYRLFGRHGVHAHEKENGQDFVFDVSLDVGTRGTSDRLEDAVDYREVAAVVRAVSESHRYDLLEALAPAVADALVARFPQAEWVSVRVRKTQLRLPVEWSGVTVRREARRP